MYVYMDIQYVQLYKYSIYIYKYYFEFIDENNSDSSGTNKFYSYFLVRKSIESRTKNQENSKQINSNNVGIQVLEKFGIIMSTAYLVVKCILSNLNCPDLEQCAQVCILWKTVTEDILSKRRKVVFLFLVRLSYCNYYFCSQFIYK